MRLLFVLACLTALAGCGLVDGAAQGVKMVADRIDRGHGTAAANPGPAEPQSQPQPAAEPPLLAVAAPAPAVSVQQLAPPPKP